MHLLIIDDEPDDLRMIAERLGERGHQSTLVNTVDDYYAQLREGSIQFDAVLIDFSMPPTNGLDVIKDSPILHPLTYLYSGIDHHYLSKMAGFEKLAGTFNKHLSIEDIITIEDAVSEANE